MVVLRGRVDDSESLSDPSDDALARYRALRRDGDDGDAVAEVYLTVGDVGENSRPRAARRGNRPNGHLPSQHVVQLMTFGDGEGEKGLLTTVTVVVVVVVVVVVDVGVILPRGIGSTRGSREMPRVAIAVLGSAVEAWKADLDGSGAAATDGVAAARNFSGVERKCPG